MIGRRVTSRISWILVSSVLCGCTARNLGITTRFKKTDRLESEQYLAIGQLLEEQGRSSQAQTMYGLASHVDRGNTMSGSDPIATERADHVNSLVARNTGSVAESVYSSANVLRDSVTTKAQATEDPSRQETTATAVSLTTRSPNHSRLQNEAFTGDSENTNAETTPFRRTQSPPPIQPTSEASDLPLWNTSLPWPPSVSSSISYEQPASWPRMQASSLSDQPNWFIPARPDYLQISHTQATDAHVSHAMDNHSRNQVPQPSLHYSSFSNSHVMPVVVPAGKRVP